jgi:hypothetical protein
MKAFILVLAFFSFIQAQAQTFDVIKTEIGFHDQNQNPSLCVVVVIEPKSGKQMAIVEDISDCFYTRKALAQNLIHIDEKWIRPLSQGELKEHLLSWDDTLEFFISNVD